MVSPVIKQLWICIGLFADFFAHGTMMSYSSCLLPGLRSADSTIKVDIDSESWLASGIGIPMTISFFTTPILLKNFGRRWVFAAKTVTLILAWLIIYLATNITTLMIGRLVGGFAIGSIYCCGCIIIAEYSAPDLRGLFLNIKTSILYCGYIYVHFAGNYYHWRTIALLTVIPCTLSFLNNLTWPESPSWLASRNMFEECEESFYWLRGRGDEAVKELESMIQAQKMIMAITPKSVTTMQKLVDILQKFQKKNFLKPLGVVYFCIVLCEASGRHFFPAYAGDIIMEVTNTKDKSNLYYIVVVDLLSLGSSISSCILITIMGRKTLLFFSGITSSIVLLVTSLLILFTSRGYTLIGDPWLVPILVGVFFALANLGCSTIPFVVYAEVFPIEHREAGAGIGGAFIPLGFFVSVKIFPYSLKCLKLYGTFAAFVISMIISLVYLYFMMPETRNRTLQEIGEFFEHDRFLDEEERRPNDEDAKEFMLTRLRSHNVAVVPSN